MRDAPTPADDGAVLLALLADAASLCDVHHGQWAHHGVRDAPCDACDRDHLAKFGITWEAQRAAKADGGPRCRRCGRRWGATLEGHGHSGAWCGWQG